MGACVLYGVDATRMHTDGNLLQLLQLERTNDGGGDGGSGGGKLNTRLYGQERPISVVWNFPHPG